MAIDEEECRRLLGSAAIGRISVSSGALPVVVPVNYVLMGDVILLRAVAGALLSTAVDEAIVAFEVDDYDFGQHRGWSVMVQGPARLLTGEGELRMALAQPMLPWGDPDSPFFVAIECARVTGRRIGLPPPAIPGAGSA
jgi:nitroimidazol reductase NimA-like FMN-containing flavoprotein (pyridoxamine 5'-phosphate oxidase superfamily)